MPPTSNHMMPLASRPMPCDVCARPFGAVTLNPFTAPVFGSTLTMVRWSLATESVSQALPALSTCTSWMPPVPCRPDMIPSDQSLPLIAASSCLPTDVGMSYSVMTTRAASPLGRGRSLNFNSNGSGPRIFAEVLGELLLVERDRVAGRRAHAGPPVIGRPLHHLDHGEPALLVEPVLEHEPGLMAFGAVDAEDLLHPAILVRLRRQRVHPLGSRELIREVLDRIEDQVLTRAGAADARFTPRWLARTRRPAPRPDTCRARTASRTAESRTRRSRRCRPIS